MSPSSSVVMLIAEIDELLTDGRPFTLHTWKSRCEALVHALKASGLDIRPQDLTERCVTHPKATHELVCCECLLMPRLSSEMAQALRAIPSEARAEASRANGRKGGRPRKVVEA